MLWYQKCSIVQVIQHLYLYVTCFTAVCFKVFLVSAPEDIKTIAPKHVGAM